MRRTGGDGTKEGAEERRVEEQEVRVNADLGTSLDNYGGSVAMQAIAKRVKGLLQYSEMLS